ncbi:hypothetical protein LCGC14_0427410 [marine sediment metagenome]|uniref:Uncharacterized protein n=1 Tax=marine sediment metagenome TaxID=412755 RepID=A0A0F9VB08_9ZZZZ
MKEGQAMTIPIKDLGGILTHQIISAPDLPDDWPSGDAIEVFTEAYQEWKTKVNALLAQIEKER